MVLLAAGGDATTVSEDPPAARAPVLPTDTVSTSNSYEMQEEFCRRQRTEPRPEVAPDDSETITTLSGAAAFTFGKPTQ
jgi:hypothetical protein